MGRWGGDGGDGGGGGGGGGTPGNGAAPGGPSVRTTVGDPNLDPTYLALLLDRHEPVEYTLKRKEGGGWWVMSSGGDGRVKCTSGG